MQIFAVHTRESMQIFYGEFYERSARIQLDDGAIPSDLAPLSPYAEFWGITDDLEREELVDTAPPQVLENLKEVVSRFEPVWESWLIGPAKEQRSTEWLAFAALVMAADYA